MAKTIKEAPLSVSQIAERLKWSTRNVKKFLAIVLNTFPNETKDLVSSGKTESGQNCKMYDPEMIGFIKQTHRDMFEGKVRVTPQKKQYAKKGKNAVKKPKPKMVTNKKNPSSPPVFITPAETQRKRLGDYVHEKNNGQFFTDQISWIDVEDLLEAGCNLIETAAYLRLRPDYLASQCQETYGVSFLELSQVLYNAGLAQIRKAMHKNVTSDQPNPIIVAMVAKTRVPEKSSMLSANSADIVQLEGKLYDMNEFSEEEVDEIERKLELIASQTLKNDTRSSGGGITEATIVTEEEENSETE